MSFDMEDLREKGENMKMDSDPEQPSTSVTERIDNSVTIWAAWRRRGLVSIDETRGDS